MVLVVESNISNGSGRAPSQGALLDEAVLLSSVEALSRLVCRFYFIDLLLEGRGGGGLLLEVFHTFLMSYLLGYLFVALPAA